MPNWTFQSPRELDVAQLLAQLRSLDDTAGVHHLMGSGSFTVEKSTDWTEQQIEFVDNLLATAALQTDQTLSQNYIDNLPIWVKALVLVLVDQINVLRQRAGLAQVTPAQALQAIRDKAATL